MSEPFLGQIQPFGFTFAPRGWALCDGQLLPISQYSALFSLFGTIYGGDGRTTFGLPDLRGRSAIHFGRGPGLSDYRQGSKAGVETVVLSQGQMASGFPSVSVNVSGGSATQDTPVNKFLAKPVATGGVGVAAYADAGGGGSLGGVTSTQGGGQAHENRAPYLTINFSVALQGLYPSRS